MHNPPWQQGWRGHPYGNLPSQKYPHPMYSQFTQQYPQPNPIQLAIPQLQQQQPLQLPNTQNLERPTQLPTQPIANPNNRAVQSTHNVGVQTLPIYVITTIPIQQIQLRSGKVLQ